MVAVAVSDWSSFSDGLLRYSMDRPDPSRPDLTYDGSGSAETMEGGLGQLTDGHEGGDDITRKSSAADSGCRALVLGARFVATCSSLACNAQ